MVDIFRDLVHTIRRKRVRKIEPKIAHDAGASLASGDLTTFVHSLRAEQAAMNVEFFHSSNRALAALRRKHYYLKSNGEVALKPGTPRSVLEQITQLEASIKD